MMINACKWSILLVSLLLLACDEDSEQAGVDASVDVTQDSPPADDARPDAPDAEDSGDADGAEDAESPDGAIESRCPQGRGPVMVWVPWPSEKGGGYCIDSTEVTREQYAEFLAAGVEGASQSADCAANNPTFDPAEPCMQDAIEDYGASAPGVPQVCVDWCDAVAFCAWAGKRLCAGDGATPNDAFTSEWYNACSANGALAVPCGDCPGIDCNMGGPLDPPSATCEGGFEGIFDLLGNVSEYTAEYGTDPFPQGAYKLRGYDVIYYDIPDGDKPSWVGCQDNGYQTTWYHPYDHGVPYVGIRCCADARQE